MSISKNTGSYSGEWSWSKVWPSVSFQTARGWPRGDLWLPEDDWGERRRTNEAIRKGFRAKASKLHGGGGHTLHNAATQRTTFSGLDFVPSHPHDPESADW